MNVFINEINLDNFSLFKAELILSIVEEMDLNDCAKEEIIEELIVLLDEFDYI